MVSDCHLAVLAIQDAHLDLSVASHILIDIKEFILIDIKELFKHLPQVTVSFELRQTNRVAHCLVSFAYKSPVNQVWLTTTSEFV